MTDLLQRAYNWVRGYVPKPEDTHLAALVKDLDERVSRLEK